MGHLPAFEWFVYGRRLHGDKMADRRWRTASRRRRKTAAR